MQSKRVVLLDRDGVINLDSPAYIKSWDEFVFVPGSLRAIRELTAAGFSTIVITNQSAIGRGMIPLQGLKSMHARMCEEISRAGGRIDAIYFCPHRPEENCPCRKPKPAMILKASEAFDIDLAEAFMVGDRAKDIECARNAGCGRAVLVNSGHISDDLRELQQKGIHPDFTAPSLAQAARWILAGEAFL